MNTIIIIIIIIINPGKCFVMLKIKKMPTSQLKCLGE